MSNKKQTEPRWIVEVCNDAQTNTQGHLHKLGKSYEQVGNKLVTRDVLEELLEHVDGKTVSQPFVISIPELIDDEFLGYYLDCHRAVMAECLVHLFDTKRIALHQEK